MCDCIERTNRALEPTGNTLSLMLFFDGSPSLPVISIAPIGKGVKAKKMSLTSPFCPFCGVKYSEGQ